MNGILFIAKSMLFGMFSLHVYSPCNNLNNNKKLIQFFFYRFFIEFGV